MGFFDSLSDRWRAWKAERREKRVSKRNSNTPTPTNQSQQHNANRPSVSQTSPSGRHGQQQISPANNGVEEDFDFDAPQFAYPARSPESASSSAVPPPHNSFRSSSPTSVPRVSEQSTPWRGRVAPPHSGIGALGSSPSSEFGSRNQREFFGAIPPPMWASQTSTPHRVPRLHASSMHESKEAVDGDDFLEDGGAGHPMSAPPVARAAMTEDERFAEMLQQQEYLTFLEESGELSREDARALAVQQEKEARRARRRERGSRAGATATEGGAAVPDVPHTPSPPIDENESEQPAASSVAAAAFASFQLRASQALESYRDAPHGHAQQQGYRHHAASAAEYLPRLNEDGYRPHALSTSSSLSALHLQHHGASQYPPPPLAFTSPSRSQSYSSHLHSSTPPSHHPHLAHAYSTSSRAPTPLRSGSLSKSELNALPQFAFTPVHRRKSVSQQQTPTSTQAPPTTDHEKDKPVENLTSGVVLEAVVTEVAVLEAALNSLTLPITPTVTASTTTTPISTMTEEIPALECSICLCEYEQDDMLRCLPCMHKFHSKCVDDWLNRSSTCPECQTNVREAF